MRYRHLLVVAALSAAVLSGCGTIGPAEMRNARSTYNDTIIATNSQQVLATIVRMRYGEPVGLLAVSSITATVRLEATAGAQFGVGPSDNFAGNLVPLSAGVTYEENPTISYTPVQSKEHLRLLLSPLPLDLTILMLGATRDSTRTAALLIQSVNGVPNPDFVLDSSAGAAAAAEADTRFVRIAELLQVFGRRSWLTWAEEGGHAPVGSAPGHDTEPAVEFALAFHGSGDEYASQLAELCALLGLAPPADPSRPFAVPVRLGVGHDRNDGIWIVTRSLYALLEVAASAVEVPPEHVESGLAEPLPAPGAAGQGICFRRTKGAPADALVAVRHHGWWYSVPQNDSATKEVFRMLDALLSVRIADSTGGGEAPLLTLPLR